MVIANGMDFINDEEVIGKWQIVGWIDRPNYQSLEGLKIENNGYNEIYFLPDGEPYWIFEGWTKGYLLIHYGGDDPIKTYKYEISNINGKKYLFFYVGEQTEVFVKVDNKIYDKATLGRHDNINLPFVDDVRIKGKWKSVGYVENISDFSIKENKDEYYLKTLNFENEGILTYEYMDEIWHERWTKDFVICEHRTTAAPYIIKIIDDEEYMFMEWRMGDYIYGGIKPDYYVFKKINSSR